MHLNITASIVVYQTNIDDINTIVQSILDSSPSIFLYIINNNPTNLLSDLLVDERILLVSNDRNLGFGAAHNIAIKLAYEAGTLYHFLINPDVIFSLDVIPTLVNSMSINTEIGLMMPAILNKNGTIQYLPKLLPSPLSLFARKINYFIPLFKNYVFQYELRSLPPSGLYDISIVSGCFSVISRSVISEIGTFDERFFLYFEDWDFSRRVSMKFRTVINSSVNIIHDYNSGANKNFLLFIYYIISGVKYFVKWGFFVDAYRNYINKKVLQQFKND